MRERKAEKERKKAEVERKETEGGEKRMERRRENGLKDKGERGWKEEG